MNEQAKKHWKKHKHKYGYTALVIVGLVVLRKKPSTVVINNVAPIFNNNNSVELGGHLRKIVYSIELDRYFESVKAAAEFAKVSVPVMSKHLNNHTSDINKMHYKIVGVGN